MRERITTLLEEKQGKNSLDKNLAYICEGGSRLYNTNDENSDIDLRAVAVLGADYQIGLKRFEHTAVKEVKKGTGITSKGDLDIEIFHWDHFFHSVRVGETIPTEMLFAPKSKILYINELVQPIFDHKELFISQNLLRHYKGMIYKYFHQAQGDKEKIKKPERIERIEKYGYETKDVMKTILYLKISIEFLETGKLNFERKDRNELLSIKNGSFKTFAEAEKYIQELIIKRDSLAKTSSIPKQEDFEKLNAFMKEYRLFLYKKLGII